MRLRRPAIAATTLGLAAALLPANGAAAAEPADRHVVYSENLTYVSGSGDGTTHYCTVVARLDWTFGQQGREDDLLSASTDIQSTPGKPACVVDVSFQVASVTMRWRYNDFRLFQLKEYSSEGLVFAEVSEGTWPFDAYDDYTGSERVTSEHHAEFVDCSSNCEWSHTLTFNSK
jgi:hypothetical protein